MNKSWLMVPHGAQILPFRLQKSWLFSLHPLVRLQMAAPVWPGDRPQSAPRLEEKESSPPPACCGGHKRAYVLRTASGTLSLLSYLNRPRTHIHQENSANYTAGSPVKKWKHLHCFFSIQPRAAKPNLLTSCPHTLWTLQLKMLGVGEHRSVPCFKAPSLCHFMSIFRNQSLVESTMYFMVCLLPISSCLCLCLLSQCSGLHAEFPSYQELPSSLSLCSLTSPSILLPCADFPLNVTYSDCVTPYPLTQHEFLGQSNVISS